MVSQKPREEPLRPASAGHTVDTQGELVSPVMEIAPFIYFGLPKDIILPFIPA